MRHLGQLAVALLVLVVSARLVHAGATPAEKCAVAKNKEAVKKVAAKANCWQKAFRSGAATADPSCLSAAVSKFDTAIAKAEAKGGCVVTGDASAIESAADTCVSSIVALTPPVPLTITKTVTGGGGQAVIHPGDTASFTITVSNVTASAAANVVVTDQLPAAGLLSWGASSGSFTTSTSGSGLLTATLLSLPAGASGSITVSASIPLDITSLPLDLPNTATVEANGISSITSSEALSTVVSGQP